MGPLAATGVYLALAVTGFLGARAMAARTVGTTGSPDSAAHNRRRAGALAAGLTAGGATVVLGFDAALAGWLRSSFPGLPPDVYSTAATLALAAGPVPAVALGAYLGARWSAGDGAPPAALRRFARGYVLVAGPALAVLALAPAIPDGWRLVGTVAAVGTTLAAATPLLVRRLVPTRPLSPAERESLGVGRSDGGRRGVGRSEIRDGVPVGVLRTESHATAMAAGLLPGSRVVFVTEGLLSRLPPREAAAIVTHEVAHHRRGHVALRLGAAGAVVLPWLGATAADVPGAFVVGAVLAGPAVLAVFRLVRWTEFDADAYAADRTGADALAGALRRLRDADLLADGGGRLASLLALHPPVERRLERLAGGDPED